MGKSSCIYFMHCFLYSVFTGSLGELLPLWLTNRLSLNGNVEACFLANMTTFLFFNPSHYFLVHNYSRICLLFSLLLRSQNLFFFFLAMKSERKTSGFYCPVWPLK